MNKYFNRESRGKILRALQVNYPHALGDRLLTEVLQDAQYLVNPLDVIGHLIYLRDKGYIKVQEVELEGTEIKRYLATLTPKGVDLMDGNIPPDPGVRWP